MCVSEINKCWVKLHKLWLTSVLVFIAVTSMYGLTGATLQARRFQKIGLPSAGDLQNFVSSADRYSALMCSKACIDHYGCKSFALTTLGECRLYEEAFPSGSNVESDVLYYIRRGEDVLCVTEIGYRYNGYLTATSSNTPCLRWSSVSTTYPDSNFIDGSAVKAENFCREPTLLDARPWCYVSDSTKEYCNVGVCCLDYNAAQYTGNVSFTETGLTCQRWDSQSPHEHGYFTSSDLQNYCRSSDDTPGRTWCYTTNPSERWLYCSVRQCGY